MTRLLVRIFVACTMATIGLIGMAFPIWAATSQTVVVTLNPNTGVLPPINLVLTRIDENTVQATWDLNGSSDYTVITVDAEAYPTSYNGTVPVYFGTGTSVNITWPSDILELYVSAWGYDSGVPDYSANYTTALTGGAFLDEIAASLGTIGNNMGYLLLLLFCLGLSVLGLWKKNIYLGFTASVMWFGMLAYHMANNDDLSGITQGGTADTLLIFVYVLAAAVVFFITLQQYRGGSSGSWEDSGEEFVDAEGTRKIRRSKRNQPNPLEEYRSQVSSAVRKNRRRR